VHFISNCSFFDNRSVAIPEEHVKCFLKAVKHCKILQLHVEDSTVKRKCFSKMFCVCSFYVDICVNRNFFVSDKVFCKVPKRTGISSSDVVHISILRDVTGSITPWRFPKMCVL
jgi:hypothetical protein